MKNLKKILALVIAASIITVLGLTAFTLSAAGSSGSGTITILNATWNHTYTAYKVFDATYDGEAVSYKTEAANADKLDDTLFGWSTVADADGYISVWALDDADESDIIDWIKDHYSDFGGTAISGAFDDANSTVTFSDLAPGYYYITSSLGTAVTITTAAPSAEVYDKNFVEPTDPVKTIIAVDGAEVDNLKEADAHVGSVVTFEVTAKTVNWTGAKDTSGSIETVTSADITTEWGFTDNPTNMTVDTTSISVTVNGNEITEFTVTPNDDGGFTLSIPMVDEDLNSKYEAPEDGLIPIVVTYDATIEKEAASAPAENEISGSGVKVYTYGFQLIKVDENQQPLSGAQFELYSGSTKLGFTTSGATIYIYSPSSSGTTLDMTVETIIAVLGLDNKWNYTLKEITVPAGYNQAEDFSFSGSELTKIESGTVIPGGLYEVKIENKAGSILPSTGGIGTTIFYVVGAVLVIGAGVVLVTRKRMGNTD